MDADVRHPRARPFDSDYWLCRCERFLVDSSGETVQAARSLRRRLHRNGDAP